MTQPLRMLPVRALGWFHRKITRPALPSVRPAICSGVHSPYSWKWFDDRLPSRFRPNGVNDVEDYEYSLVKGLISTVREGDHVVVVGGGIGVTAVVAARQVGIKGRVTCYEASKRQMPLVKRCLFRNEVADRVKLIGAAVGTNRQAYGGEGVALRSVSPTELPECDVLEMDCEGAEAEILAMLKFRPRAILVETHGVYGATTASIADRLAAMNYQVTDLGWAEPRVVDVCEKCDIRVLLAEQY